MGSATTGSADCEYVVVGSGAGGGTLAARLAEEGRSVVLLEAGGEAPRPEAGAPGAERLPEDYEVPAFHMFGSENPAMRWDFFVRHYADDARQRRDDKYREEWEGRRVDGVYYPRAGTLGGCTAHNAMILMYPHNADWDALAEATGDPSWSASAMRRHFVKLERCRHRPVHRWLSKLGLDRTLHGWDGWLQTEKAIPRTAFLDGKLMAVMMDSILAAAREHGRPWQRLRWLLESQADPNDWRLVATDAVGVRYLPLSTRGHRRTGARERVLDVAARRPDLLKVETDALATRVLFDGDERAVGVEYLKGPRLYRAHPRPNPDGGERRQVRASREVVLAGGAFNSPQLLMLSGVGPPEELERHGIPVRVGLPGVGGNLQDRYEVGVVNRMAFDHWGVLAGARFARDDPQHRRWRGRGGGVYASNGAVLAVVARSSPARPLPDLACFALLGPFYGYFPAYSSAFPANLNCLTWAVVKAHTRNRAGRVTLRSPDPRDPPAVVFRYFEEGDDAAGEDLDSVVEGIRLVRRLTADLRRRGLVAREEVPGEGVESDDELREFVRDNAWGHHASCTCAIGPPGEGGVLSSDFRVHGTRGLRVVDASVFPRTPGFFPVGAVYMVAEKAAEVMLRER
ncbi:MAG TPA: GMC family oxidoreductase [Vicinamibacteria bacterium]|nr:GMC family oxidoreductase [Vicinamibacteria bacterium]